MCHILNVKAANTSFVRLWFEKGDTGQIIVITSWMTEKVFTSLVHNK